MKVSRKTFDLTLKREVTSELLWEMGKAFKSWRKNSSLRLSADGNYLPASRPEDVAVHYLERSFLSKYVDENTLPPEDRQRAAIVKWLGVEQRNRKTNKRIYDSNPTLWLGSRIKTSSDGISCWDLLFRARDIIYRVLGDVPSHGFVMGGFTSGASTSKRRFADTLPRKFTETMDATPRCAQLVGSTLSEWFQGWYSLAPEAFNTRLVKGNVLFTVPKNAEIDRVACKEPDLNLYCQKAVGDIIRKRLRKVGINLNDQSRNQQLAKRAFFSRYATIDLSSASDSISREIVRSLLPPGWFDLLDSLRCEKTFIGGASHVNEMFSSMGNGFTFELESLIFYSLAKAVTTVDGAAHGSVVGVYGDDLIIHQVYAPLLISLLKWCGFKVNENKSFIRGTLFESCGKHYFHGVDVSPFFLRSPLKDVSDLIQFLNQLRSWMIRCGIDLREVSDPSLGNSFYSVWSKFTRFVPRSLHGGWDLNLRTQLVTLGASRARLEPVIRRERRVTKDYQLGMYLARLAGISRHDDDTALSFDRFGVPVLYGDSMETLEFPHTVTGKWRIRRYDDVARFFGIATNPLHQEMV